VVAQDQSSSAVSVLLAQDWTALCRRVVEAHRAIFAEHAGIAERSVYEGLGEGGDRALAIDRLCEDAVFAELEGLERAGHAFVAVSEERGQVEFGKAEAPIVVIDPIDGSLNARRTIPSHSLSIAVASGPSMADVDFAYVYDFGAGEEFVARRGEGTELDGRRLRLDAGPQPELEVVGLEAAEPGWIAPIVDRLDGRVYRLRALGSIAISLAYVATGRFDGMLTARPCRSVDAAAGQLIAREAGAFVAFGDSGLDRAFLDLDARYPLAAAASAQGVALLTGKAAG
jgi:myo-inositol-1(or 4)-monophosphatase